VALGSLLTQLEDEAVHIIREACAGADRPALLYSIGKDSSTLLHLARKAFHPAPLPFPLLHVDTTYKFREMYRFREEIAARLGVEVIVHRNPDAEREGINPFDHGSAAHTDRWKTEGLKQAIELHGFDLLFGGARRDEERSRAKERIVSIRSAQHRWEPKAQRPEFWDLYNARRSDGQTVRAFPMSNWTELDIWRYIRAEQIPVVPLYFAAERPVVRRGDTWIMVDDERMRLQPGEQPETRSVRFRTLGCYPLSGGIDSTATSLDEIIDEIEQTRTSERHGRLIDTDSVGSMERKKQDGYF
jgi:sulfate adenylyltransferase subunit 2